MYKCDKCICIKCKNYFGNGGNCENCSMCTVSISNKEPCKTCDDFCNYYSVNERRVKNVTISNERVI